MIENIEFYRNLAAGLTNEFQAADGGEKTSLLYAKNPIPTQRLVEAGNTFQVLIIGGTHTHCATLQRRSEGLVIVESSKKPTPILHSREVLMDIVENNVNKETTVLGLNFAFPMQVIARGDILDGTLVSGTKEHTFNGLVGKNVGEEIEKELFARRGQKIQVAVCNDTVSLGLAGLDYIESKGIKNARVAAGIVGTGFNFGLFTEPSLFVNLESGNFSNFEHAKTTNFIDKNSTNPGKNIFEKEVGGRYLWEHFNLRAEQEGLNVSLTDGLELSNLAEKDLTTAGQIASEILERAAGMVAAEIAAVNALSQQKMPTSSKTLYLAVEGSVFWNAYRFADAVKAILYEISNEEVEIFHVENSGILGTARLVG